MRNTNVEDVTKPLRSLLVYPPAYANKFKPRRACFPLGIGYIASVLREHRQPVDVLDCVIEGFNDIVEVKEASNYMVFGLYGDKLKERIKAIRSDIVGISCPYYTTQKTSIQISKIAKETGAKWVVLGGQHASGLIDYFLAIPEIDFIIIGEGDLSFLELVQTLQAGQLEKLDSIDGIAFKKNGKIHINPKNNYIQDLDSLPFPARDMFPMEEYFRINVPSGLTSYAGRATEFVTSRGCPHECWFCASTLFNGNFRARSLENIIHEMQILRDTYGVRELQLVDDNLTQDRERVLKICKNMVERKMNLKWGIPNAIGTFALDEEIIKWLSLAGFYFTHLSIESGSQRVLSDIMKKPTKINQSTQVVKLLHRYGIDVSLVFCIGNPGEQFDDMEKTFRYAATLPAYEAFFYFATPLPGTELYNLCRKQKYVPENFLELVYDFQEPIITTPDWSPKELKRFVRKRVILLHFFYFLRNPFGFVLRYYRRYCKNASVLKSFFSFILHD
jgi:radical SAM superfamily enzyme YgiQ (UPF0313 family)